MIHQPRWWRRYRDLDEREHDERTRLFMLLAMRDATLVLLALLVGVGLLAQVAPARPALSSLATTGQLSLLALFVWAGVLVASRALRGVVAGRALATYHGAFAAIGLILAALIPAALVLLRGGTLQDIVSTLGVLSSALCGGALTILIARALARREE